LLGVTLFALALPLLNVSPGLLLGSALVFAAERKGVHPILLIVAAALLGSASSLL
jgi:hypothetical protein